MKRTEQLEVLKNLETYYEKQYESVDTDSCISYTEVLIHETYYNWTNNLANYLDRNYEITLDSESKGIIDSKNFAEWFTENIDYLESLNFLRIEYNTGYYMSSRSISSYSLPEEEEQWLGGLECPIYPSMVEYYLENNSSEFMYSKDSHTLYYYYGEQFLSIELFDTTFEEIIKEYKGVLAMLIAQYSYKLDESWTLYQAWGE